MLLLLQKKVNSFPQIIQSIQRSYSLNFHKQKATSFRIYLQ